MDGTFKVSPNIFHQAYTIHGIVGSSKYGKAFPLVFCLLSSAKKRLYKELLKVCSRIPDS